MKPQERCYSCLLIKQGQICNFLKFDIPQICPCYECIILPACKEYCDRFLGISLHLHDEAFMKTLKINEFENIYETNSLKEDL